MKRWARDWDCCQECGRTDRPHEGRGLCRLCYKRQYLKTPKGRAARRRQRARKRRRDGVPERGVVIVGPCSECGKESRSISGVCRTCRIRRLARAWKKANPDKKRAQKRRRKALKRGATVEPVDEQGIYDLCDNACVYCEATEDLTLDHVIPLAGGGAHSEDNLVVACRRCNSSKNATPLAEWLEKKEVE